MVESNHNQQNKNMPLEQQSEAPVSIVDHLNTSGLFEAKQVGPNTISAISIMGEHEKLAGNVLRRICKLGGEACAQTCALHQGIIEQAHENEDKKCADENLKQVVETLGIKPDNVFMVGVGKDNIGFVDEVDSNPEKYAYSTSPVTSIKELPGFDSFFTAEGDTIAGEQVEALGRRLADCGDINLEFIDRDGRRVMGFMHMSKPNLQGEGALKYEYDGKNVGSFEYFLRSALYHYGGHVSTVKLRVTAAIKPEHYTYTFDEDEKLDQHFPGWKELGLVTNVSNPDWKPGSPIAGDKLHMDFRGMLEWQMSQVTDLKSQQINWENVIDPGDNDSPHASNHRGGDFQGRDAYFTAWADKLAL